MFSEDHHLVDSEIMRHEPQGNRLLAEDKPGRERYEDIFLESYSSTRSNGNGNFDTFKVW